MYETGKGVPKNDTEAVKWYRLAADVNGTERCPVFGKIRCPIFCTLKDSNPGGYPEAALPSSSFTATLSIPALRLVLSR
jgi:hypothetical protein